MARRAAGLVVLPALAGLLPLSALAGEPPRWDGRLVPLARRYGGAAAEAWEEWAAGAARTLGIYLCAGTVVLPRDGGIEHVALCFGPDGRLLARQPQLHRLPGDAAVELVPGDEWNPFTVEGWPAALVVGGDGWVPEVGRWASLEGVRLILHPAHRLDPVSPWDVIAGPWQVVQQTQIYWVHAAPGGEVGGKSLAPRAAVFAPCEITPGGRGWLVREDGGLPAAALLERPALESIRQAYPLDRYLNPGLYLRELLPAYRAVAAAPPEPVPAPPVALPKPPEAAAAANRRRRWRRRRAKESAGSGGTGTAGTAGTAGAASAAGAAGTADAAGAAKPD